MSCSHASTCPLFPRLNHTLASWKSSFCDSDEASLQCARYKLSLTGQPVPLGLLPNGVQVSMAAEVKKPVEKVEAEVEQAMEKLGLFARFRRLFAGTK
jgi:hypothetical protein